MEAAEYIRWKRKMCEEHDKCELCPVADKLMGTGVSCDDFEEDKPAMIVSLVEKWKEDHNGGRIPLRINEFADAVHENAIDHGWWEEVRSFPEIVALCHSELSEALEAYRDSDTSDTLVRMVDGKPEGIAVEMVDCVIRILDYLAYEEVDIEYLLMQKHQYNCTRPYKHGGKRL